MKNCNKEKKIKNLKSLLNLIRFIKIDEILNIKANANKKIEQILKQFKKKKIRKLKIAKFIQKIIPKNYQVQTTVGK